MKKVLSLFLAISILFTIFPLTVFALNSGEWMYAVISEQEKTCKIVGYDGYTREIIIPAEINGYKVIAIDREAFCNFSTIGSVVIPDTVRYIGRYAFYHCENLERVTIPNGVAYMDDHAFACTALYRVEIPASVEKIEFDVFYNCRSLTSIDVDAANENYSSIDGVLFNKSQTELICFPAHKVVQHYKIPGSVTHIENQAFLNNALPCITIPDSVISIGTMALGYSYEDWGYTDLTEKIYGFTIFGEKDSVAEIYAKKNGFRFILIDALGDLSCDNEITAVDARWALQSASGARILTDEQKLIADVNHDGKITAIDARWILQASSGIRQL